MKDTFRGGVHPAGRKELSRDVPLREFLPTGEMVFPLAQHIGKPAKPIVKKGDTVLVGQRIAEADGFVSAHVICSCSGTVKGIEKRKTLMGSMADCIVVDNDGQFTPPRITPGGRTRPPSPTGISSSASRTRASWAWAARAFPPT